MLIFFITISIFLAIWVNSVIDSSDDEVYNTIQFLKASINDHCVDLVVL